MLGGRADLIFASPEAISGFHCEDIERHRRHAPRRVLYVFGK
jgi:hypothetical protein